MTSLIRWEPFGDIAELRSRIDRMFDDKLFAFTGGENGHWTPAVDVTDSADQLTLRADLPGIDPKDVKVTVEGDLLTIEGERKEEKETKEAGFVTRERRRGSFMRRMRLPEGAKADAIKAEQHDGVLTLTIPKEKAAAAAKREITVATK